MPATSQPMELDRTILALYDLIDNTDRLPTSSDQVAHHLRPYEYADVLVWLQALQYAEQRLRIVEDEIQLLAFRLSGLSRCPGIGWLEDVIDQRDMTANALESPKCVDLVKEYAKVAGYELSSGNSSLLGSESLIGSAILRQTKQVMMESLACVLAMLVRKKEVVRPKCEAALLDWCRIARTKGVYD